MKLMKQVISDLVKEIGWVILYGFLTAMVIMAFVLISLSYTHVVAQNEAISRFVKNDIVMLRLKSTNYSIAPKDAPVPYDPARVETLDEYYADVFSEDGNAGTFVEMTGRCGYQRVMLVLGVYADLTPFSGPQSEPVTFVVSPDKKDVQGDTITLGGTEYPVQVAPAHMEIYHPLYYMDAESGMLEDTLYVFSHDLNAVKEIFPSTEYWELYGDPYFGRLILKAPTAQDLVRVRNVISKNVGGYVSVETMADVLRNSQEGGERTHQTYMLFYVTASLVLLGAMILNIYNTLKRKIPDYATHHLFGASGCFLFARMFLFTLLYHAIPLGGTMYIMQLNELATPGNIAVVILVVLCILFAVTGAAYRHFCVQFARGLRRE